jgi:hypothetical protein
MRTLRTMSFLAVALLAACSGDYTVGLPNGYFLARTSPGVFGVCRPDNRYVTGSTSHGVALAVIGDLVVGEFDVQAETKPVARYFVIDTKADQAWVNLTHDQYAQRLRELRVSATPQLTEPSRLTRFPSGG